jgi:hypothetical protein
MNANRRRGAQPGNQNALKHGLYCQKPGPGPSGNLKALIKDHFYGSLLNKANQQAKPLDEPAGSYAELSLRLQRLNEQLDQILNKLAQLLPDDPQPPERKNP